MDVPPFRLQIVFSTHAPLLHPRSQDSTAKKKRAPPVIRFGRCLAIFQLQCWTTCFGYYDLSPHPSTAAPGAHTLLVLAACSANSCPHHPRHLRPSTYIYWSPPPPGPYRTSSACPHCPLSAHAAGPPGPIQRALWMRNPPPPPRMNGHETQS
jgi:hypothetical protein